VALEEFALEESHVLGLNRRDDNRVGNRAMKRALTPCGCVEFEEFGDDRDLERRFDRFDRELPLREIIPNFGNRGYRRLNTSVHRGGIARQKRRARPFPRNGSMAIDTRLQFACGTVNRARRAISTVLIVDRRLMNV